VRLRRDATLLILRDRALSVSASDGRTLRRDGVPTSHILDPVRLTALSPHGFAAAVAPTASQAEAWSTAALVLLARDLEPLCPPTVTLHLRPASPAGDGVASAMPSAPPAPLQRTPT
jgi:thiamine biosynthesis lipoprotein ApbE